MIKKLLSLVSLSCLGSLIFVISAQANSFSDITGGNIWNNNPPILDPGDQIDPALIERVNLLNENSQQAYIECNSAIDQIEANAPDERRLGRVNVIPPVPQSCQELQSLRQEMDSMRNLLESLEETYANPSLAPW